MLNLIRMNLYRMAKMKSLWLIMLFMGMFCIFSCAMAKLDLEERLKAGVYGQEEEEVEQIFGISVAVPEKANGEIPTFLEFYNADLASGIILIFLTIACCIYFNGETKSGFLKNIAGQTKHKSHIYIAKIFVIMIYTLCALVIYGVMQYIELRILLGGNYIFRFGTEYWKETGLLVLAIYLLYLGFAGGISLITTVCKSTAVGISVGLLSDMGVLIIIGAYLEKFLNIEFVKYMIVANVNKMFLGVPRKEVFFAIGVGVVFSIIYYSLGTIYFSKKDVV